MYDFEIGVQKTSKKENFFLGLKSFPIIYYTNTNISCMLKIAQVIQGGLKGDKWFDWKGNLFCHLLPEIQIYPRPARKQFSFYPA